MSILGQIRRTFSRFLFGGTMLPQELTLGLMEPQTEVSLWLHGIGAPQEVTARQTTACTAPLILCVAFHDEDRSRRDDFRSPILRFCENSGMRRVLGEIRLTLREVISVGASEFVLYVVRGSTNYCLPRVRLWAHYAVQSYQRWRRNDPPDIKMTPMEERAACVTFIRPHFLSLVSIGDAECGNIFPMNLMGELGNGYFGFALRELRLVAHQVERAGRMALSGVPLGKCAVPFALVGNHRKECADWTGLPFPVEPSSTFQIPFPAFASRVREMRIEKIRLLGSHRFFIARIVSDQVRASTPQACVVHGFYQYFRLRGNQEILKDSVAADMVNRGKC
jgi:hypothetical protein